jgi:hypothetical protein
MGMTIKLDAAAIRDAISEAEWPICDGLYKICRSRAAVDGPSKDEWQQLWAITGLYPSFDLEEEPSPLPGFERLDAISDERLKEWAVLADEVGNADLVARTSDLYWLRRQPQKRVREDIDRARTAVGAYITSASNLGIDDHCTRCYTRMQRALRLARTIGDTAQRAAAVTAVVELIRARAPHEYHAGTLYMLKLLKSEQFDGTKDCISWCTAAANSCAKNARDTGDYRGFDLAAEYRKLAMFWLEKAGEADKLVDEWREIATYYLGVSELFVKGAATLPARYGTATHWMERHIDALRSAKADAKEIDVAHRRLLELQRESLKALRATDTTANVTRMANAAIDAVEGKDYPEALLGLLTCVQPASADDVRKLVARTPVMIRLIGNVRINEEGKQIAIREGVDQNADSAWAELVERARTCQLFVTEGGIMHAMRAYNAAFPMRLDALERMAAGAQFVPEGREKAWARGLHAGFVGDWMLVAHLLPPQIEHALRRYFEANGVIASGLHRSRQHEYDLNKLLTMKEATALLGENLQLDLAASLAHGFGSNVRNYVCHGLFDDEHYRSLEVIYVWWQALRLMLVPQLMFPSPPDEASGTEGGDQSSSNKEDAPE